MKTDPRKACANTKEDWLWARLHDAIAHPFMVLTNYSGLSLRFHDYTSAKAWPRPVRFKRTYSFTFPTPWGFVDIFEFAPGFYEFSHPRVDNGHVYRFNADDREEIVTKVLNHLQALTEFGGTFSKLPNHMWTEVL